MPSPKAGTVTPNVGAAVKEIKAGKVEYRLDKTNIIHCPIGKVSFGPEKLQENMDTLLNAVVKAKPAAAKGQYIRSCVVASTWARREGQHGQILSRLPLLPASAAGGVCAYMQKSGGLPEFPMQSNDKREDD